MFISDTVRKKNDIQHTHVYTVIARANLKMCCMWRYCDVTEALVFLSFGIDTYTRALCFRGQEKFYGDLFKCLETEKVYFVKY